MMAAPVLVHAVGASRTPSHHPTVYVVDDDDGVRDALVALLTSVHLPSETYASAEDFLAVVDRGMRGCLVLDVRMPGMNGLELQRHLQDQGIAMPVLIITGHGDVPMAVRALKSGASDFVEKPFNEQELLDRIQKYLQDDHKLRHAQEAREDAMNRFSRLTPREMSVMELIAAGIHTKRIASQLEIQSRTVDVHRFNIMRKIGVRTLAGLLQCWSTARQPNQSQ